MAQSASVAPAPAVFERPPILDNGAGRMRTVGIEIEFLGPTAMAVAHALAAALGGEVRQDDPYAYQVRGTRLGDVAVELDSRLAHPAKDKDGILGEVEATLASWFGAAASYVVPCELVTAPLPLDRLHELDAIIDILRAEGARGTQDGALYAFGLHFNPEAPRRDVGSILAVLRAFVLLNAWLRREIAPDTTRYLLGFADPFPEAYVRKLLRPDYAPGLRRFIDDYLDANPTRNRDLDLLPLLLDLDEARVRARLPAEKIGRRPTFHYRLPDARVSDPAWTMAPDWNRWVAVERLAADPERLARMSAAYLAFAGAPRDWADVAAGMAS